MLSIGTSQTMENMITLTKQQLNYNDWFIIYMIKRNTESIIFEKFIEKLHDCKHDAQCSEQMLN